MYLDAAAASIALRGQVEIGDRTMLDALMPAADAVRRTAAGADDAATAAHAFAAASRHLSEAS